MKPGGRASSSLFRKYATVLVGLVASMLLIGGGAEIAFNYRDTRQAAAAVQGAEARSAAARIDSYLSSLRNQVAEIAALPWAGGLLAEGERRPEYLRLLKVAPPIEELRHVDAQGRERLRVSRVERDEVDIDRPASHPELVRRARAQGHAFGPAHFRDGFEPFVMLAVKEGGTDAVTLAELNLKFVGGLVSQIRIGERGQVFVLDGNHLVAHPDLSLVLRKPDLGEHPLVQQLRAQQAGAAAVEARGLEGADVIASAAPIAATGWLVAVEQPRDEVLGPVYASLARTLVLMVAGLVAALIASYYLARRLAQPIIEVRRGAESIGRGELDTRIEVRTGDEVESLALEFNRMAGQLREYTTGLERKVDEKTAELQAALRVAQEATRARSVFLAAASHDLRQPLYAIAILADTLASAGVPPESAAVLERQRQAIAVLQTLFDNLLDLSRFDAGEIRPQMRRVALRDVLVPVAMEHEVVCQAKRLALHCRIADGHVTTDPALLRRLVGNLLANASRYTHEGSVTLEAVPSGDGSIEVSVSDTGIGIEAKDQARVFDEFVQIDNPARARDKGVGLGLSIVKRICELLGLELQLVSTPGRGTRIAFTMPLAPSAPPAAEPGLAPPAEGTPLDGRRIWIVEDDPLVQDAVCARIEAWGARVSVASSREELEALRDADGDWPDAVILDDMLGGSSQGLELAQQLARHLPAARLVLVTGNVDGPRLRELEGSGFVVVRKPLASSQLLACLRAAVEA